MKGAFKFYNFRKGWGYIITKDSGATADSVYFHISNVSGPLVELLAANHYHEEPIKFEIRDSQFKPGHKEAYDINLDEDLRGVGHVVEFENGYGWIEEFGTEERFFLHYSKICGTEEKFISISKQDPVVFTRNTNEKGNEALNVVKVDNRCSLEKFAEFEDFHSSLDHLKSSLAEREDWDYINNPTGYNPVLFSYINHTFDRAVYQSKLIEGKNSKTGEEYLYFNTGLVTPFQDEIFGYFKKLNFAQSKDWGLTQPEYEFIEFNTEQSRYRVYFPEPPQMATYFSEAEVKELIFDTSLNGGRIIVDKNHIKKRQSRFPDSVAQLGDEAFFDALTKSVELAVKRVKRNYKTAIPHYYDGKIQFLLPLCMLSKKDADLALVVNKEEQVYKAHTVLTLDQAFNNARLLAKPDREWLNP